MGSYMKATPSPAKYPAVATRPSDATVKPAWTKELSPIAHLQNGAQPGHHLDALPIGSPDDRYEQEADQAAEQVIGRLESRSDPSAPVQATPTLGPAVQAKREGSGSAAALTQLSPAPSSGRPLEPAVRAPMERAFGAGLGDVRLHTDGPARQLNGALSARAVTVGRHVYFDQGEYRPGLAAGRALLAHELAHVLQQRRGGRRVQRRGRNQGRVPDELVERLMQADLDQVRPRAEPARSLARAAQAYSQGSPIHVGPGAEYHLPHEAWHVIQQRQGGSPSAPAAAAPPCDCDETDNGRENASQRPAQAAGPGRAQRNAPAFSGYQLLEHDPNAIGRYQALGGRPATGRGHGQGNAQAFSGYQPMEHDPNAIGAYQMIASTSATGSGSGQGNTQAFSGYQPLEHDPNAIGAYQMIASTSATGSGSGQGNTQAFSGYQPLEHDPNAIGAYQMWDDEDRDR
jgi:hypothetical protein